MEKLIIKNSKGERVYLTDEEAKLARNTQRVANAMGANVNITTLTEVIKSITTQKFFEVAPADYFPVVVGNGAWSAELTTFRSYSLGGDFETGLVNTGQSNARLAQADAGVDSISVPVHNWAKAVNWSKPELEYCQRAVNFDLITAKETSRKRNWDLGIQKAAFVGLSVPGVKGLLNQTGVSANSSAITKAISTMTGTELKTAINAIVAAYRTECNYTAWPTHFVLPESDYLALAGPSDASFHIKSTLEVLQETFRTLTKNPNFQIMPLAYGDSANNPDSEQRYALYNADPESLRMDIPVDYVSTLANTMNGYQFESVGYGQFTGLKAYRPKEMLYFKY